MKDNFKKQQKKKKQWQKGAREIGSLYEKQFLILNELKPSLMLKLRKCIFDMV